jgi:hypothetical protein
MAKTRIMRMIERIANISARSQSPTNKLSISIHYGNHNNIGHLFCTQRAMIHQMAAE